MPSSSVSSSSRSDSVSQPSSSSNYTITHHAQMERESQGQPQSYISIQPNSRDEARQAIISSLTQILEQPLSMLRNGTIGDEQMKAESTLIPGSSLGKHLRHVHDHYRILLDSIESSIGPSNKRKDDGRRDPIDLDYDKRSRVVPLETSAKGALKEFEGTQNRIKNLLGDNDGGKRKDIWDTHLDRPVKLSATTPIEIELGSTIGREMWFVCLHAIHHYALARVILVHELGLKIDDSFGVAPSTLVMRIWNQASSRENGKL